MNAPTLAPEFLPEKEICLHCRWHIAACHCQEYDAAEAARAEVTFTVRPVNTSCRYCGDPIDLFTDSAHYCCRECRDCAYNEMERPS